MYVIQPSPSLVPQFSTRSSIDDDICISPSWISTGSSPISDPFLLPKIGIDRGAIRFLLAGANMMCPGMTSAGGWLPPSRRRAACRHAGCDLRRGQAACRGYWDHQVGHGGDAQAEQGHWRRDRDVSRRRLVGGPEAVKACTLARLYAHERSTVCVCD